MFWFLAAVGASLSRTATHILNKRLLVKAHSLTLLNATSLLIVILYAPLFLTLSEPLTNEPITYWGVGSSVLLNICALLLFFQALKEGELSVAVPLRNLVPLFVLIWGILLLAEPATALVVVATLLIVTGSLLLHHEQGRKLTMGKPSLYALAAAILYSFAIIVDKYVLSTMEPLAYTFFIYAGILIGLTLISAIRKELGNVKELLLTRYPMLIAIAIMATLGSFLTFTAISLTDVTKVTPVLRLEILFSVLAGGYFFKEKAIAYKLTGTAFLFVGILLILLG